LGGVYKFSALKKNGQWQPSIKISESEEKTPNPGDKQVFRIYDNQKMAVADMVALKNEKIDHKSRVQLINSNDNSKYSEFSSNEVSRTEPLLEDVLKQGKRISPSRDIHEIRELRKKDLAKLYSEVKEPEAPQRYKVAISPKVWQLKQELIEQAKEVSLNAV